MAVRAGEQRFRADAIVCALGSYGTGFLRPLGIGSPSTRSGVTPSPPADDGCRGRAAALCWTRPQGRHHPLRRTDRVGGMAELSGFNLALNPRRHDTLAMVVGISSPGEIWSRPPSGPGCAP